MSALSPVVSLALIGACTPEGIGEPSSATEALGSATEAGSGGSWPAEETTTRGEGSTGESMVCEPGSRRCSGDGLAAEICAEDGLSYGVHACSAEEGCVQGACLGPCDLVKDEPSSAGCAFTTQASADDDGADGLMVTNISDVPASVQLLAMPRGTHDEAAVGDAVVLAAGEGHLFELPAEGILEYSAYSTGGSFRVVSDHPVVVHQQALQSPSTADSGLLLPDHALGLEHVVASYSAVDGLSCFTVVALEDKTRLRWTPPADSAGSGLPIPFVPAGETGELMMLRGDTVRIGASALLQDDPLLRDLSGSLVWADKPIAVVGSSCCAQVPAGETQCARLYEPILPVQAWGQRYVGGPAPSWQEGAGRWRIYAGADGVTVEVETVDEQPPLVLAERGDWVELDVGGAAVSFTGDGPFLPVYYLQSVGSAGGLGAPSMVQAAPAEQLLTRYAFSTGVDAEAHFVQVIRRVGAASVMIDDALIDSFEIAVGGFEIAEVSVEAGSHVASSDDPFGLVSLGHAGGASYAHLAGVGLAALTE